VIFRGFGIKGNRHKYNPKIGTFKRYDGDFTNYLIENSLVSIALLLTIRPIEYLFSAFINIKITQLNTIAVAVAVGKATVSL
jgi:hypothetical protein